jgi:hypothetical protein
MTLEDLGNIGDFLGGIGVVITLVYLAFQIRLNPNEVRENTKSAKASAFQSIASQIAEVNARIISDPDMARIMVAGSRGERLSPEDQFRFDRHISTFFRFHDTLLYQFQQGMLEQDHWDAYHVGLLHVPLLSVERAAVGCAAANLSGVLE